MEWTFTTEQREFQAKVRRLAEEILAPGVTERDISGEFPAEQQKQLAAHGLYGMKVPQQYGGLGLDTVTYVLALSEIARVDAAIATSVAAHNSLCCGHLLVAGTEEQKQRFLPRLAKGECVGAWGLTERGAGSDAGGVRTRAVRDGDAWVLNGEKMFITHGSVAGVYIILASTDPYQGRRGISAFVLERDTPGLLPQPPLDKMGLRASDTAAIRFENCRIPAENQLGALNAGFPDALRTLEGGRISIAAVSIGLAQAALDASVTYAKAREQFGQPIAQFQAIQFMLADMATELAAARLLACHAAAARDAESAPLPPPRVPTAPGFNPGNATGPSGWGAPTREGSRGSPLGGTDIERPLALGGAGPAGAITRGQAASMAKLFASEMATRAALKAVQIHGGYGYLRGVHVVERLLRDTKFFEIGEGTSEIQRLVIARDLLKE